MNQAVALTNEEPIQVELLTEESSVSPGHSFWVAVHFRLADSWHIYWKNPGDGGMAPQVDWSLPPGFTIESLEWPTPKLFEMGSVVGYGYDNDTTLLVKIKPDETIASGSAVMTANLRWVVCSEETCLPGRAEISTPIIVRKTTPQAIAERANLFKTARSKLPHKNPTAEAILKNGKIYLDLKMANVSLASYEQFQFFPETSDFVEAKAEITNINSANTLKLKVVGDSPANTNIKGVVVLSKGDKQIALEVDAPLFKTTDEGDLISLADQPEMPTVIAPKETEEVEFSFMTALLFALVGGMILNLMPCVLPVLSLKILSFVQQAGKDRLKTFKHGLAFSSGVLVSFWVLAGLLLILQASGSAVGWGFQLQEPLFVAFMAAFMLIFALSLFGVFELGTSLASKAGEKTVKSKGEFTGSFFSGVLATAVATPCTGPFLGTAVGYAVTLAPWKGMTIFSSVGLGMSFPYLVLAGFPSLMKWLPRPGAWMVTFKEFMGFLMMASVLWLFWVFAGQTNEMASFALLIGLFVLSLGGWLYGRLSSPMQTPWVKRLGQVLAISSILLAAGIVYVAAPSTNSESTAIAQAHGDWETFSPDRILELRKQGIPVFVDFTAKWCLLCQANHVALSTKNVKAKFEEHGVVKMKGDWTKNDPVITEALKKHGRNSVPLYLLYPADLNAEPIVLPQVLSPDMVIKYMETHLAKE